MKFYLVRNNTNTDDNTYYLTNYIPYKADEGQMKSVWYWHPKSMKNAFEQILSRCHYDPYKDQVLQLGGEIPCGSVKDLQTGEIIAYENLLPFEEWVNS